MPKGKTELVSIVYLLIGFSGLVVKRIESELLDLELRYDKGDQCALILERIIELTFPFLQDHITEMLKEEGISKKSAYNSLFVGSIKIRTDNRYAEISKMV